MTVPLTLTLARQSVDKALAEHSAAAAKLHHPSGDPVYTDTPARLAKLLEPVQKSVAAATAAAEEVRNEAKAKRLTAYADPIGSLHVLDLEKAFYRRSFVADDAAGMSLPDLARRLEAVAMNKADSVGAVLHARYARRRYDAELAASRKDGDNDMARSAVLGELEEAVKRLEAITQPDTAANELQAAEMEAAAWDLENYASRRLADLDGRSAAAFQVRL